MRISDWSSDVCSSDLAIDVDPRPVAAGKLDPASRAPRGELQPFTVFRARRPDKRYTVTVPIGKPNPAVALPPTEGPADPRLPPLVTHPRHGGPDPPAVSPSSRTRAKTKQLPLAPTPPPTT